MTASLRSLTVPEMLPPTAPYVNAGSPGKSVRIRKKITDLALQLGDMRKRAKNFAIAQADLSRGTK
jgi:hypothetical protein